VNEDLVIRVGADKRGRGGIPYRAIKASHTEEDPEKGILWFIEYQVAPDPSWRPRATFYEKDGVFTWGDRTFPSAYAVLRARVNQGP